MRQPLVPWPGNALLLGAALRRVACDGVQLLLCKLCAVELRGPCVRVGGSDFALDPNLGGAMVLPVGKQADAVACSKDLIEVVLKGVEGEVLIDGLRHLECGLYVERYARHNSRGTQPHDRGRKMLILAARQRDYLAVGGDHFEGGNRGGEIAVVKAGTVGGGGNGTGHGDMRQ